MFIVTVDTARKVRWLNCVYRFSFTMIDIDFYSGLLSMFYNYFVNEYWKHFRSALSCGRSFSGCIIRIYQVVNGVMCYDDYLLTELLSFLRQLWRLTVCVYSKNRLGIFGDWFADKGALLRRKMLCLIYHLTWINTCKSVEIKIAHVGFLTIDAVISTWDKEIHSKWSDNLDIKFSVEFFPRMKDGKD